MTQTKLFCGLWFVVSLSYFGCSSTSNSGDAEQSPAPPVALAPEPEPEPVVEPEAEEVVLVEPEVPDVAIVPEIIKEPVEPEVVEPEHLTILGFIKYVELEGGFFGIMTEDGHKYFPEYLEPDFKQDGLNVRVVAQPQEQILGIQMWGTPIEILRIEAN